MTAHPRVPIAALAPAPQAAAAAAATAQQPTGSWNSCDQRDSQCSPPWSLPPLRCCWQILRNSTDQLPHLCIAHTVSHNQLSLKTDPASRCLAFALELPLETSVSAAEHFWGLLWQPHVARHF